MNRSRGRWISLGVLGAGLALNPIAASAETVPPDLGGELFYASGNTWLDDPDAVVTTSYHCDDNGGRVTFSASGTATGPYPGPFAETMTVTIGAATSNGQRQILSIDATFTIDSAVGDVSGTKTLDTTIQPGRFDTYNYGACSDDETLWFTDEFHVLTPQVRYSAFIRTADATYSDSGTASLFFSTFYIRPGSQAADDQEGLTSDGFEQSFRPDEEAPVLVAPTDTAQCKDDGWRALGFRNQGACVSYVASQQRAGG